MALGCLFGVLAQVLLLVNLVDALDINYCSPDNTGSSFQQGKGPCSDEAESQVNGLLQWGTLSNLTGPVETPAAATTLMLLYKGKIVGAQILPLVTASIR